MPNWQNPVITMMTGFCYCGCCGPVGGPLPDREVTDEMSRKRPGTDTPGYQDMMRRLVRRAGTRAAEDTAALAALAEIQTRVDAEMTAAVRALNEAGHSWDEIATVLGKPRQNVWRKYAVRSV